MRFILKMRFQFRGRTLLFLFNRWVVSDSLWPHGLQQSRPACPSLSPGVCPSSCPSNQWCHPIISSSAALFSFCLQSFPASGSFPTSRLFASVGQIIEASASASVLQWVFRVISFRIDWFDLLADHGTLQESSPTPQLESNNLALSLLFGGKSKKGKLSLPSLRYLIRMRITFHIHF